MTQAISLVPPGLTTPAPVGATPAAPVAHLASAGIIVALGALLVILLVPAHLDVTVRAGKGK